MKVQFLKIMPDGELLFERGGTHFRLSSQNIRDLQQYLPADLSRAVDMARRRTNKDLSAATFPAANLGLTTYGYCCTKHGPIPYPDCEQCYLEASKS